MITKPFVLVTTAALALFVYIGVMIPLLPRLIEEQLGGNEIDIGFNLAMFSIAAVLIGRRLGRFAERHGLRSTMVARCAARRGGDRGVRLDPQPLGIAAAAWPAGHR